MRLRGKRRQSNEGGQDEEQQETSFHETLPSGSFGLGYERNGRADCNGVKHAGGRSSSEAGSPARTSLGCSARTARRSSAARTSCSIRRFSRRQRRERSNLATSSSHSA